MGVTDFFGGLLSDPKKLAAYARMIAPAGTMGARVGETFYQNQKDEATAAQQKLAMELMATQNNRAKQEIDVTSAQQKALSQFGGLLNSPDAMEKNFTGLLNQAIQSGNTAAVTGLLNLKATQTKANPQEGQKAFYELIDAQNKAKYGNAPTGMEHNLKTGELQAIPNYQNPTDVSKQKAAELALDSFEQRIEEYNNVLLGAKDKNGEYAPTTTWFGNEAGTGAEFSPHIPFMESATTPIGEDETRLTSARSNLMLAKKKYEDLGAALTGKEFKIADDSLGPDPTTFKGGLMTKRSGYIAAAKAMEDLVKRERENLHVNYGKNRESGKIQLKNLSLPGKQ